VFEKEGRKKKKREKKKEKKKKIKSNLLVLCFWPQFKTKTGKLVSNDSY
jgi:hypothetical protein